MIRRPPRSTLSSSSAASDVYKRQFFNRDHASLSPSWRGQHQNTSAHGHKEQCRWRFCISPLPAVPRMETSTSTWSSMKRVRSFWTKGRHLSDLEFVQTRLALSLGMPAACSNPSRGSQQTTRGSLRSFPTSYYRAWQAARPFLFRCGGSSEKKCGSRL